MHILLEKYNDDKDRIAQLQLKPGMRTRYCVVFDRLLVIKGTAICIYN